MFTIHIEEEMADATEVVDVLNGIATLVKEGYTSGISPTWDLIGDAETRDLEDSDFSGDSDPAGGVDPEGR